MDEICRLLDELHEALCEAPFERDYCIELLDTITYELLHNYNVTRSPEPFTPPESEL